MSLEKICATAACGVGVLLLLVCLSARKEGETVLEQRGRSHGSGQDAGWQTLGVIGGHGGNSAMQEKRQARTHKLGIVPPPGQAVGPVSTF